MPVPAPEVDDLKAFNLHLLEQCDQDMLRVHYSKQRLHEEVSEDDREALLPMPYVAFDES